MLFFSKFIFETLDHQIFDFFYYISFRIRKFIKKFKEKLSHKKKNKLKVKKKKKTGQLFEESSFYLFSQVIDIIGMDQIFLMHLPDRYYN